MQKKLALLILALTSLAVASCGASSKSSASQDVSSDVSQSTSEQSSDKSSEDKSESSKESSSSVHTHTYSNEWSKDGTHHWHAATCEHTEEKKDYEEHTFGEWKTSKEAEEGVPGLKYKECSKCGYKVEEVIDALGHDYQAPTYEWSNAYAKCTATRVCSHNSEHVETETVDSVFTIPKEANCTEEGLIRFTATFANPAFETQVFEASVGIIPDAHHYIETVVAPTADEEGYTVKECEYCHDSFRCNTTSTESKFTFVSATFTSGYRVTGYTGEAEIINVPATHEGLPVTEIGEIKVGKVINIPDSVNLLEYNCFNGNTTLEQVSIPNSITRLEGSVFYNCSSLKSIVVPDSVTFIDSYTFYGCTSLEEMTLPFIGKSNTYTNRHLCSIFGGSDNAESNATYVPASLKKVTIGKACTSLESYAFFKCQYLEEVVVGENVASIGNGAFGDTKALKVVRISKGVQTIDPQAFYAINNACAFEEFIVDPESEYYSSEDGVLYNKDKTALVNYPCCRQGESFAIPDTVTEIGAHAFRYNQYLQSISMNDNVITLGWGCFYRIMLLGGIVLSNNIKVLPNNCLQACPRLRSVTLPDHLEEIGPRSFDQCPLLTSLSIPATVNKIGESAFYNTLTSLVFEGSVKSIQFEENWNKYLPNSKMINIADNAKPYGIMVNNETYNGAKLDGFAQYDQKALQFRVVVEGLQVGDTFTFYDDVAKEAFNMNIDPYSFDGSAEVPDVWERYLDFDGNKYTIKESGTYDFFIKINGTNNNAYITKY